jgi:dihydrofolate reductase
VREVDADAIQARKAQRGGDIALGSAEFAAEFLCFDPIDEFWLCVNPVVFGSGTPRFRRLDGQ